MGTLRARRADRRIRFVRRRIVRLAGIACLAAPLSAQSPAEVAHAIRARLDSVPVGTTVAIAGERIAFDPTLVQVYDRASSGPLWSDEAAADLDRFLDALPRDGLDPALYHRTALRRLAGTPGAGPRADLDLLRTAALRESLHDLRLGRVRPALPGIGPEFTQPPADLQADALLALIRSGGIVDQAARWRPAHFVYRGLQAGLDRLLAIAAAGGWDALPAGRALRRDSADAGVPALRRRLSIEGYAAADSGRAAEFDAALERAVVSFQHHHGLNEDGVVGARTRAALDVPVEDRIDQVRINLERARWLNADLPRRFVVVNTAGAKVYLVDGEQVLFESRAIVGKLYTKSPIFSATLRTVEIDPTWTVPPGIVAEVLSQIRKDPAYLARETITLLDGKGRVVDPATVDFVRARAGSFPYTLRQEPGPTNPLGRIKLLFPNRYNVYLHDTPSRQLFEREDRTFSHGCIRVADPFGLAAFVLGQPDLWSAESLRAASGANTTRVLPVPRPVPVLVYYWTASADERGELHYYRDAYGRDPAVLRAISAARSSLARPDR